MKNSLFLLFFLVPISLLAGDKSKIETVVYKWDEIHRTHLTNEFLNLFDDQVLFYGRFRTKESIYNLKTKFLTSDFQQKIISPLKISYYKSGVVKCDFIKRTFINTKKREHACYLLLKKVDGNYKITGESDLQSDENRNVQLNLGPVAWSPQTKLLTWSVVIISLLLGFYFWKRKKQKAQEDAFYTPPVSSSINNQILETKLQQFQNSVTSSVKEIVKEEIEKIKPIEEVEKEAGKQFENYLITKFDREAFGILNWQSDKFYKGRYAESNMHPDFLIELRSPYAPKTKFAVECKYRSAYFQGGIELAKDYQLKNYRNFEKENRTPVFIILGVGGSPMAPDEIFTIPLKEILNPFIYKTSLQRYKKTKVNGTFFFDPIKKILS